MNNKTKDYINSESFKRRLLGNIIRAGARNFKISKKQEMKLSEWIVPYLSTEFGGLSSEPLNMKDIRIFIDQWESSDLKEGAYKYYYVKKNSEGKSFFWDWFTFITISIAIIIGLAIRLLYIK
jgi:hypothetical protein